METLTYAQLMKAHYNSRFTKMIRLGGMLSLIFFGLLSEFSCSQKSSTEISLVYEGEKAKAVAVPLNLLQDDQLDLIRQDLTVRLKDQPNGIIGEYALSTDRIIFTPAFPFTPGKAYDIF